MATIIVEQMGDLIDLRTYQASRCLVLRNADNGKEHKLEVSETVLKGFLLFIGEQGLASVQASPEEPDFEVSEDDDFGGDDPSSSV